MDHALAAGNDGSMTATPPFHRLPRRILATARLPTWSYHVAMSPSRTVDQLNADFLALEASVDRAGAALACTFSCSDEFEAAVIQARRARGAFAPWYVSQIRLILATTAATLGLAVIMLLI